uniref:Uncharacterized protein n=1 Tax=Arundo donax TaxID=35708 RepID=A0A0A9CE03_ARUDO
MFSCKMHVTGVSKQCKNLVGQNACSVTIQFQCSCRCRVQGVGITGAS